MKNQLRVLIAQMNSTDRVSDSVDFLHRLGALAKQCDLLALPEMAPCLSGNPLPATQSDPRDFLAASCHLATDCAIWVQTGSMTAKHEAGQVNRALLLDDAARIVATYDKIHLFDAQPDASTHSVESRHFSPGSRAVLATTPWGRWGLTICYDLRFPHLFRAYAHRGARLIFVPSAFTVTTGRAHWEAILRTRAIENGCWIIAAAQVGVHPGGRRTHGHSLIVNPWGEVVLDLGDRYVGPAIVEIDLSESESARRRLPSLHHDRAFELDLVGD